MTAFEIKDGVAELSLQQLKKTTKVMDEMYLPKSRPVYHDTLVEIIAEKVDKIRGIKADLGAIYVPERAAKVSNRPGEKFNKENCPIENWIIERFTTRIDCIFPDDKDMNMYFGISYNERGITLAMGLDVWICKNQNVFGGKVMSTYGKNSMPYDKMIEVVENWTSKFTQLADEDYSIAKKMRDKEVSKETKSLVIGKLFEMAVLQNNSGGKEYSPLNQTQVGMMVKNQFDSKYINNDALTVWDLNQWGTDALRPHNTDIVTMYQDLNAYSGFLINEFQLN